MEAMSQAQDGVKDATAEDATMQERIAAVRERVGIDRLGAMADPTPLETAEGWADVLTLATLEDVDVSALLSNEGYPSPYLAVPSGRIVCGIVG